MNRNQLVALIFACLLISAFSAAEAQPLASNAFLAVGPAQTAKLTWLSDLPQALARAKVERKCVLLFFHGFDWCPTCVEMQRQVFGTSAFAEYARKRLVLVDVDFPEKQQQNENLRRANLALKAKFNLSPEASEGFPTLVLLADSGETVFQETGYAGGGPAEILPKLQRHAGTGVSTGGIPAAKDLSVEEFARMAADKQNVILDVRTAGEFAAGHLPGAINLDVTAADFAARAAALDQNKVYLVHCAAGVRSARACTKLVSLGFPNLYNLPGGFRAWVKAGQAVEK